MNSKVSAALALSLIATAMPAQARDGGGIAAGVLGGILGGLAMAVSAGGDYPDYAARPRAPRPRPVARVAACGLKGATIPSGTPMQMIAIRNTDQPELNFLKAQTRVVRAEIVTPPCNAKLVKTSEPLGFRYVPRPGFVGRDIYAVRGCNDVGSCSITAFVVDVTAQPAVLSNASPDDAFKAVVSFDRPGGGDELFDSDAITPTMARFLSSGLAKDWTTARSTHENVFDASVFTGRQSTGYSRYSKAHVVFSSDKQAIMEAVLDTPAEGIRYSHRQSYSFVKEIDGWKLDEIDYAPGEKQSNKLHADVTKWIADNPEPVKDAAQLSNGVLAEIARTAATRAEKIYSVSGMVGLTEQVNGCNATAKDEVDRHVVLECLAFTWASLRMDNLGSVTLHVPPVLDARKAVAPLEERYRLLGGVNAVPMKMPQLASSAVTEAMKLASATH